VWCSWISLLLHEVLINLDKMIIDSAFMISNMVEVVIHYFQLDWSVDW
jgi:hypothetical protein